MPYLYATDITLEDLGTEVLIYQKSTSQAHCLTGLAATVWRSALSPDVLAQVRDTLPESTAEEVQALLAHFLEQNLLHAADLMTRQQFLKKAALAASLAVLVSSVSLAHPTPALAY